MVYVVTRMNKYHSNYVVVTTRITYELMIVVIIIVNIVINMINTRT